MRLAEILPFTFFPSFSFSPSPSHFPPSHLFSSALRHAYKIPKIYYCSFFLFITSHSWFPCDQRYNKATRTRRLCVIHFLLAYQAWMSFVCSSIMSCVDYASIKIENNKCQALNYRQARQTVFPSFLWVFILSFICCRHCT